MMETIHAFALSPGALLLTLAMILVVPLLAWEMVGSPTKITYITTASRGDTELTTTKEKVHG